MDNIDKQIIYEIYKQHREKVNDIINDKGYNIYANIGISIITIRNIMLIMMMCGEVFDT